MAAKTSAEWCDNNGISSIENRDLFDSCWSATIASMEAQPPAPNKQSTPCSIHGDHYHSKTILICDHCGLPI
jgi:hypothetical protein